MRRERRKKEKYAYALSERQAHADFRIVRPQEFDRKSFYGIENEVLKKYLPFAMRPALPEPERGIDRQEPYGRVDLHRLMIDAETAAV